MYIHIIVTNNGCINCKRKKMSKFYLFFFRFKYRRGFLLWDDSLVYLVMHGVFLTIVSILRLVQSRREKDRKKDSKKKKSRKVNCFELITTLIHIFLVLWFFYGKYIIFNLTKLSYYTWLPHARYIFIHKVTTNAFGFIVNTSSNTIYL